MAEKLVKAQERRERLAAALRENLKKRKNRVRRLVERIDDTNSQPSIEPGESGLTDDKKAVSPGEKPR
jgi:hypothetical protein